jgi:carbon-monoxide dehydrogenase medium subunit
MLEMAPERATGPGFGVLRSAARWIGHYPIRTRGTIGGSVAHADPAAEWCMLAVALGAQIHVRSVAGERVIGAEAFFRGHYTTALRPEEMVVAIAFPEPAPHAALAEHARRHGDFALAAACVRLELSAGRIVHARVVLGGVAGTPLRVPEAERLLEGSTGRDGGVDAAARAAAAAVDPPADIHATSEHRRRLVAVLVRRACREAAATPTTWEGAHAAAA